MKIRLSSRGDLMRIWKDDFLGNRGFFLPGEGKFSVGEEMEVTFEVEGKEVGKAKVYVAWQNLYGRVGELTPRGTFLRVMTMDEGLERSLGI